MPGFQGNSSDFDESFVNHASHLSRLRVIPMVLTTVVAKKMELSMSQLDVFSAALETPTWCDRRTSSSSAVNDVLCTHVLFSGHSIT